jgi:hypothetical protein
MGLCPELSASKQRRRTTCGFTDTGELAQDEDHARNQFGVSVEQIIEVAGSLIWRVAHPTISATGKRTPSLKLDNPRQFALMHALVRLCHVAAGNSLTTTELPGRQRRFKPGFANAPRPAN